MKPHFLFASLIVLIVLSACHDDLVVQPESPVVIEGDHGPRTTVVGRFEGLPFFLIVQQWTFYFLFMDMHGCYPC